MFSRKTLLAFALLAFGSFGCGPTRTELVRTTTVAPRPTAIKMIIVGVSMHQSERAAVENELVADLRRRGIDAHPSYEVYANLADDTGHAEILAAGYETVLRVQFNRVDHVIMTDDEHDYIWTKINIGTSLWDTTNDHLLWTAETLTKDPVDEQDLAHSVAGVLVPELTNALLILGPRRSG